MKTVIEMAYKVFDVETDDRGRQTFSIDTYGIERFAELVRADEREQGQRWFDAVTAQHKQAILAEREACAKVCYELPWKDMGHIPSNLAFAAAIRARSNT